MKRTSIVRTAAVAAALGVGTLGVATFVPAVAGAQEGDRPGAAQAERDGRHPRARALVAKVADLIGVRPLNLVKELRAGKSIAQVATDNGVDPQVVVDALVADGNARIDAAVEAGRIPAEKAETVKAKLAERVPTFVDRVWGQR
jgi:hypothetical protein